MQCLNVTQLLRRYGLETSSQISPEFFIYMCPALLYQIDRRLCIVHYDELEDLVKSKTASIESEDKTGASGRCVISKAFCFVFFFVFCIVNFNFCSKFEASYSLALTAE